ncbi:MAG TPA: hypothetical protein VMT60_01845 [Candidatus Bathyarchaeia archaeon]|nr:hypothetical protein [Candidatus Bathyarchaeia archaeon]
MLDRITKIFELVFYVVTSAGIISGVRSWLSQVKGKNRYECAKNMIAGAYRIRDQIEHCRSPFMSAAEWVDRKAQENDSPREKFARVSYAAYRRRFSRVMDALNLWLPTVTEAEALFGPAARDQAAKLERVVTKLSSSIEMYHQLLLHEHRDQNLYKKLENTIYGVHPGIAKKEDAMEDFNDDGFQSSLDEAIRSIREYFTQFIK